LQKYFLQILAGISNAEIVLDPQGYLVVFSQVIRSRLPRRTTEPTSSCSHLSAVHQFRLRPPTTAQIIGHNRRRAASMEFVRSNSVSYYRMGLPLELIPRRFDQGGTWQVLLDIGRPGAAAGVPSTRDRQR
jgi:hypothetical protein